MSKLQSLEAEVSQVGTSQRRHTLLQAHQIAALPPLHRHIASRDRTAQFLELRRRLALCRRCTDFLRTVATSLRLFCKYLAISMQQFSNFILLDLTGI